MAGAEEDRVSDELADRFPTHLSPSDAVMWDIEKDPVLRSTIAAVAVLDRAPDWQRLRTIVDRASRVVPRLRQRVLVPPMRVGPPRWVVDQTFDLDYHLRRVRVPQPATLRAALDVAQPIAAAAFDRARPLWEFTLIEGLEDGSAVFVQKLHHSMTDGVGLVELAMELLEEARDSPVRPMPPEPVPDPSDPVASSADALGWWARSAMQVPGAAASSAVAAARHPLRSVLQAGTTARSVARVVAPMPVSDSPILRERSLRRRFHTLDVDLDELRAAGHVVRGSVNDAFVAAVVEGLRRYHVRYGLDLATVGLTMPVSLRGEGDTLGGNRFAPARFRVPAQIEDPRERMRVVRSIARSWRDEPALASSDSLAFVLDRLPLSVTTAFFGSMLKHVDAVVTNVPGLPSRAYLAGAEIMREYAFAPPTGAAINVALVSHLDLACIGVVVDLAAAPDDEVLLDCLVEGLDDVMSVIPGSSPT